MAHGAPTMISGSHNPNNVNIDSSIGEFPSGFRFHPTEEEMLDFYLRLKIEGKSTGTELISFIDIFRYEPCDIPGPHLQTRNAICSCLIPASTYLFISKYWCKYKKRSLAVVFLLLEATSFMLDQFGGSQLGFHLASVVLSALSFVITIYSIWITKTRITSSSVTKSSGADQMQNIAVEVAFSLIQLIITFVYLIRTLSGVKTDNSASFYPLAYSVITVVFAFVSNGEEVSDSSDPHKIPSDTVFPDSHTIPIDEQPLNSSGSVIVPLNPPPTVGIGNGEGTDSHIIPIDTEPLNSSGSDIVPLNPPPLVVIGNGDGTNSSAVSTEVVPSNTPTVEPVPSSSASDEIQGLQSTLHQRITTARYRFKEVVLKLELYDDKAKIKAMKIISGISGVESVRMDMKNKKMIVIGDMDPIDIMIKLRKLCHAEIVSVGPAKEPEKNEKEQPEKEEQKTDDYKKKDVPKRGQRSD
ncbi:hypothetical protein ACOSQ3_004133 [Xanthoceras sorbifolium]